MEKKGCVNIRGTEVCPKGKDKKKKKEKSGGLWSKIRSKFDGPSASEAATGFAKRMKGE